jgi:hypothetical protein
VDQLRPGPDDPIPGLGRPLAPDRAVVAPSLQLKQEMPSFPALHQGGVRYLWDGEETYGMIERSYPLDKITRSA